MKTRNKLFLCALALGLGAANCITKSPSKAIHAYDGLTAPAIETHLDTSAAIVYSNSAEQNSFSVSDMIVPSVTDETDYFKFDYSDGSGMVSEKDGNKCFRAVVVPVTFSIHLEANKRVTFSEINIAVTAYKTTSSGSAACLVELFNDMPTTINGYNNNSLSTNGLVRTGSNGTGKSNANYNYGSYTFINNSNEEADVYLPKTFYFALIVKYASTYSHLGVGLVGIGDTYCTDIRNNDDKEIRIEFDNANTVYYRQSDSNIDNLNYSNMSPVVFENGTNSIFDATVDSRFATFKEKTMNRYFNVILIPFRFVVNLDAYEMINISQFEVELTIRKIAGGGTAGAFVEVFSTCPDVIKTTLDSNGSTSYSVGKISTTKTSANESKIHDRISTNCAFDGYSFVNDSSENADVYTNKYYYIAICGHYASTYDHIVEATMNVVPAQGDEVISYTRNVTKNGTLCSIVGGETANYQSQYVATIIPNEHYECPSSVEVLMGDVTLVKGSDYSYSSSNGQITINANVVTDDITINVTAVPTNHRITYNSNDENNLEYYTNGKYLSNVNLQSCSFTKLYYSFKEWNTDENGEGISYDAGESYQILDNIVLYAIWYQSDMDIVDQFVGEELHFNTNKIETSNNSDTGACKGESGYYAIAKDRYNNLSSLQKELFCTENKYSNARDRLNAWAIACGENLNNSTYQLQAYSRIDGAFDFEHKNYEDITLLVVICAAGLASLGCLLLIKIKKKND